MKISLDKTGGDEYALRFDDTEVILDGDQVKHLLMAVMKTLAPGELVGNESSRAKDFIERIKTASDVGIQKLLLVAEHDDMLMLLKSGQDDQALQDKFIANMSDKLHKIFEEDLLYQFTDGVPEVQLLQAVGRLIEKAAELEEEGTLTYESA